MHVIGGSASGMLASELAKNLGATLASVESKRFPDDECYVRIEDDLDGEEVVIVQTAWPDKNIIELLLLQDAAREFEVASITTVVPYFGYARQDKKFKEGEPVSARALARSIQLQSDEFLTVDVHAPSVITWFDSIPAKNVSAHPEVGAFLRRQEIEMVLSPDEGRWENAKRVASVAGCEADFLVKERLDGEAVRVTPKSLDVSGKKVAIVDDIISTGGTIVKASEQLRAHGAVGIIAVCTHGVFSSDAVSRLRKACNDVYTTDTIENPATAITVAPQVAKAIRD